MARFGLGPRDDFAPSSEGLALELGEALPSCRCRARLSWSDGGRFEVGSRALEDMGREGNAVRMEAASRWWPKGGTVGCSLISIQVRRKGPDSDGF